MNNLDINLLRNSISKMRIDIFNGVEKDYTKEYSYLYENTPSIFFLIKENDENYIEMLNLMLSNAEYVQKNNDDKDTALTQKHNEINEILAEKYIYPVVGKPDQS